MYKTKTNELEQQLEKTHPSQIADFLQENAGEILNVQSQLYTAREDENTSIAQKLPS